MVCRRCVCGLRIDGWVGAEPSDRRSYTARLSLLHRNGRCSSRLWRLRSSSLTHIALASESTMTWKCLFTAGISRKYKEIAHV